MQVLQPRVSWQRGSLHLAAFNAAMAGLFLIPKAALGILCIPKAALGLLAVPCRGSSRPALSPLPPKLQSSSPLSEADPL